MSIAKARAGRRRHEDPSAWDGDGYFTPGLLAGCSSKASVGSSGAWFWWTTSVRESRVKLHPGRRREAAHSSGRRTGSVPPDWGIGPGFRNRRYGFVDAPAHRSQRGPGSFLQRVLTSDGPIRYRVFGPDGAGLFPKTSRFVELLVGGDGTFAYQKTFGAQESFTVRDLAISLDSARTTIVDEDGLVVEEIATHHGDCPSVAYRISYKSLIVVFSGDMDASALPNLVQLAKNADLLIFNCAVLDPPGSPAQLYALHTPPQKIGEAARKSGVKSLLLSHLAPDVEGQQDAVRKSIRASFVGPVAFASDRMRVPVGK
jgi:hypothetical protein